MNLIIASRIDVEQLRGPICEIVEHDLHEKHRRIAEKICGFRLLQYRNTCIATCDQHCFVYVVCSTGGEGCFPNLEFCFA